MTRTYQLRDLLTTVPFQRVNGAAELTRSQDLWLVHSQIGRAKKSRTRRRRRRLSRRLRAARQERRDTTVKGGIDYGREREKQFPRESHARWRAAGRSGRRSHGLEDRSFQRRRR